MFIDRWWKTGSLGIFVRLKSSEMQQRRGEKLWFCRQHGKSNKKLKLIRRLVIPIWTNMQANEILGIWFVKQRLVLYAKKKNLCNYSKQR